MRIEKEHMEALRLARQINAPMNVTENMIENSEILHIASEQCQYTEHTPKSSKIFPKQLEIDRSKHITPKMGEIPPKGTHQVTDLEAMEEGAVARNLIKDARGNLTQTQHTPKGNRR